MLMNQNNKILSQIYIDSILKPIIKKWLDNNDNFVLEEDSDWGHGHTSRSSAWHWKRTHGLKIYKNCLNSSDFALIEACWQSLKERLNRQPHWDEDQTLQAIKDS